MMKDDHEQIEALLNRALEFKPEARAAFLAGACNHDLDLLHKVETLLESAKDAQGFMEGVTNLVETPLSEGPGTVLGRYKLLQKLGEGGMGAVYMAEQTEPVIRKVALKIIKLGMDTKQVVARFEAERQALAMMEHPNIARVLDAGATETGRPYFVMELVRGVPITEYCDKNKLSTEERLKLFMPVCHALQHAHQKGVIHRDVKPSNVMVTLHDGNPVPKVIDFGIAKATNQKLTEKTFFTNYAQMIGTPAYMSPEQAEMSGLDVDTRTDVYSLGVLLYELLTGTTPFPSKELLSMGYGEMQKIIAEKEPPKLSTCLSTMQHEERTGVANNRSMEESALGKVFVGDLDWIVMKALEKDRTRRYETVNELAADVERHLNNDPVSAVAPTFGYQLQKFVRRNRKYARAAAMVSALLVVAVIVATWQAVRATRAMRAEQEARKMALRQREVARTKQLEAENAREAEFVQKQKATSNEHRAIRLLYASEMRDAHRALAKGDRDRAVRLLENHIPSEGQPDFRDWEWRWLWAQSRSDALESLADFPSAIHSLSVSHDGRFLAVGRRSFTATNALAVIDLRTRRRLSDTLVVGHGRVRTAFSPVDDLLAFNRQEQTGRIGDEILLWDSGTGKTVDRFSISGSCAGLQFSGDGQRLFVASDRGANSRIVQWDVPGRALRSSWPAPSLTGYLGTWESFAVDNTGGLAAYTRYGADKGVSVMDLDSGKVLWSTDVSQVEAIIAIALSPDGQLLATCEGADTSDPVLWNARTGEQLCVLEGHRDHVKEFLFWPDGKTLATAGKDQSIRIWDISDSVHPRLVRTLQGHRKPVWQLALAPDLRTLFSGSQAGRVMTWDVGTSGDRNSYVSLDLDVMHNCWFFETGGQSLVGLDATGQVIRASGKSFTLQETLFKVEPNFTPHAAFSENRRFLAVAYHDGRVVVWDMNSKHIYQSKQVASAALGVASMRNDGTVLLGTLDAKSPFAIQEWDLSQPEPSWSRMFKVGTIPFGAESPDGQWIVRPHDEEEQRGAWLMNRKSRGAGHPLPGLNVATWARFSMDGTYFAITSLFENAAVIETASRRRILPISDNLPRMRGGAFSPDNRRFASGGRVNTGFNLYDFEAGQVVFSIADQGFSYYGIQYSSDGNLIGAQSDGMLHIWHAPSWEEIRAVGERDSLSD